jgi:kynureninase
MMSAFYQPTPTRNKILIEKKAFPSDIHAMKSQLLHHNFDPSTHLIELGPREGEETLRQEDIEALIVREGDSIAVIQLSGVQYYTGQLFDIEQITALGHRKGCIVGWDLAHAVGNVPLKLHDWNVDFACWCSYKYLNCGPGSIGGCFVHSNHTSSSTSSTSSSSEVKQPLRRLAGWWGHRLADRFDMSGDFVSESGADGFRVSNPSVLLLACVRASMDLFDRAGGMTALRAKSVRLTAFLETMLLLREEEEEEGVAEEVVVFTPRGPDQRGCQLSLSFRTLAVEDVNAALKLRGVICDVRKPNVMRIAPTPLYNSFEDVFKFVCILKEIIKDMRTSK